MADAICSVCRKVFYAKPSHLKRSWGKYCSITCRTRSQFKGKLVKCFTCGKEIYRSLKDLRSSISGNYFCSRSCQTIWRNKILFSAENHANWKFGKSAYRRILDSTGREKICTLCKIKDTRVLIVHHIDKNRENNNVKNLTWLCQNCHSLVHHYAEAQNRLTKLIRWL